MHLNARETTEELTMQMGLTMELFCEPPAFGESVLVRAEQVRARHKASIGAVIKMLRPPMEFRSRTDALAATFVPELFPAMKRFYEGRDPDLQALFPPATLRCIDRRVAERMKRALLAVDFLVASGLDSETWEAVLRSEISPGGSAATKFLRQLLRMKSV